MGGVAGSRLLSGKMKLNGCFEPCNSSIGPEAERLGAEISWKESQFMVGHGKITRREGF